MNWRRWDNNFGNSSAILRTFPGDRAARPFHMTSLANRQAITSLMTSCIAVFVVAGGLPCLAELLG